MSYKEHGMDNQSANSEFGLNHYFDLEQNTNSLTVDSGIGNRHSIREHSTDYSMVNSGFDLNHNFDQEPQDIRDEIMNNLNFEELDMDYLAASNGIAGIQTGKGNTIYLDKKHLMINVLTQGKEHLNQLRIHLGPSSRTGEFLMENILPSFNMTLSILNSSVSETQIQPIGPISSILGSPHAINGDPQRDDSNRRDREKMPSWTERVRVHAGTELKDALVDGYSWEKYGQQRVLGAKYPRCYYRCAHHYPQNCRATKHVQHSKDDPSIVEVTYQGEHTCIPAL